MRATLMDSRACGKNVRTKMPNLLLSILFILSLGACGQSGALYLPGQDSGQGGAAIDPVSANQAAEEEESELEEEEKDEDVLTREGGL